MCTVCGCGSDEVKVEGDSNYEHEHTHDHGHHHSGHHYLHQNDANIDFGTGPAGAHVAGMSQQRMVQIEQDILAKNDRYAERNRSEFAELGLFVINLVSSPGSGKTTLLTETIKALKERLPITVIEGDQQTANDAERIRATGVPALQINTGKGCHLDAHMVGHALEKLKPAPGSLLMIENVGNLVCPAAFDLGEAHKVAILSVTEGEDKPLKYPNMFHAADLMLLNKIDLLPHIDFDIEKCIEYARCVNPNIQIMQLSATTGDGMTSWLEWVKAGMRSAQSNRGDAVTPPKECNHQLEDEVATIGAQLEGYS